MGYVSKFNGNEIDVAVAKVLGSSEAAIAGCVKLDSSLENPVNLDAKILPGYYSVDYYESTVDAPIDVQPLIFYVQRQPVSNRLIQIINNGPITYARVASDDNFSGINWKMEPNFGFIALVGGSLPDPNDDQYPEWGIIALVTDHGDKPVLYIKLVASENPTRYMWVDYLGIGKIEGIVTLDSAGLVPVNQIPVLDYDPLGSASVVATNLANFIALKGSASGLAELDANQKVPINQIPSLNYDSKGSALAVDNKLTTLKNSIGAPNGIAELGDDGKVPAGQLPSLNYDPVGSSTLVDQKLTTFMNTKGAAHGLAELDDDGKVPSSQLPSYVDDVLEYDTKELFPAIAESGKIYVDKSTNLTWRWSGSTYVSIASSLAIGVTSSTAHRGDHGKIAYDHSQITSGNPHHTTTEEIGAVPIAVVGANNGVASLGDDGKVPKAQLPKINAEQVVMQSEEPTLDHTVLWIDTSGDTEELNLDNLYASKIHSHTPVQVGADPVGSADMVREQLNIHIDAPLHVHSSERELWNSKANNNHDHGNITTDGKIGNLGDRILITGIGCSFSNDLNYLAVAVGAAPAIAIYKRNGDTFTKLDDPSVLPAGNGFGCAFSPDSRYLAVVSNTSPFIAIYKRNGDTFTKLDDPAILPSNVGYNCAFSPDGRYLTIAHSVSPFITTYKRDGDIFTKLDDPTIIPSSTCNDCAYSPNGVYLAVAMSASPFLMIYKRAYDAIYAHVLTSDVPSSTLDQIIKLGYTKSAGITNDVKPCAIFWTK